MHKIYVATSPKPKDKKHSVFCGFCYRALPCYGAIYGCRTPAKKTPPPKT